MNAEQARAKRCEYMRTYREKNPQNQDKTMAKLRETPTIKCECGGHYKDTPTRKAIHEETLLHLCWDEKNNLVIPMFLESGKATTTERATERIEAHFKKSGAYTPKKQLNELRRFSRQLNAAMGGNSQTLIKFNTEGGDEVEKVERNVIIPPTPQPSEEEPSTSEEEEESDTESDTLYDTESDTLYDKKEEEEEEETYTSEEEEDPEIAKCRRRANYLKQQTQVIETPEHSSSDESEEEDEQDKGGNKLLCELKQAFEFY